jgi:hypothetical protein
MGGIPVMPLLAILIGFGAMMLMQGRPRREKVAIGIPALGLMGYVLISRL